jgi:hypothetical protein
VDNEIDKIKSSDQFGICFRNFYLGLFIQSFSNTSGIIFRTVTGSNQGMELFDHRVLHEKSFTDHQQGSRLFLRVRGGGANSFWQTLIKRS